MNAEEAGRVHRAMMDYIKNHGSENVTKIEKEMNEEFSKQKQLYINEEKERIVQEYKVKLQQDEIKLRIQKSSAENAARIQKMKTINQLIEKLYKEAKHKMILRQKTDVASYQLFLKNVIVQVP